MVTKLFSKGMHMIQQRITTGFPFIVYSIFKELAVYEKMEDQVKMKIESKIFTITMTNNNV